jgi:hypothetical protein
MSAIFIEKIKNWISYMADTPVSVHGWRQELLAWAIIAGAGGVIWLIGELVYRIENKKVRKK